MKAYTSVAVLLVSFHLCSSFMTFSELGKLIRCYNGRGDNRMNNDIVNGQTLPLPSSMETFVSIVERLEAAYPSIQPTEMIRKLLVSFRADEVPADLRFENPVWEKDNLYEKALFDINNLNYAWKESDFTADEQCALHFMLSHSVNSTLQGTDNEEAIDGFAKHPREYGVVSLHAKPKHALALGKVLLGIYAGLLGNNQIDATALMGKIKTPVQDDRLNGVKINRLIAATIADLVVVYIRDPSFKRGEVNFMPNGEWDDVSCTTQYLLENNNKRMISNSLIRGAVDGAIIGKRIEENPNYYRKLRLSQILRMYYGPTGLIEETTSSSKADIRSDFQWCKRQENFRSIVNVNEEVLNYLKFYTNLAKDIRTEDFLNDINDVLGYIQGSTPIFNEVSDEATECSRADSASEKCKTPSDIFPILDWQANDNLKNLQIEVLGILSTDFEVRPFGSSVGAYTNLNSAQSRGLYTIANTSGIAGCSSCYARHFPRISSSKQGEVEVLNDLNFTLTEFIQEQDSVEQSFGFKTGKPAKVILLFNFGSPLNDHRLRDALWVIKRNFREATVLAIGSKKENLNVFTQNPDSDVFTDTGNAIALAAKLKARICKAPAEFQFKECLTSNRGTEYKQSAFIPANKKQFWAMYPKYFLKSYGIKLKVKATDGAQVKVCFSRSYFRIIDDGSEHKECREPGEEAEFWTSDPCKKRDEHNCDPFYFSIEGVKPGSGVCESIYCRTPKDILFEFSHEGISCNSASFLLSSSLLISLSILLTLLRKTG